MYHILFLQVQCWTKRLKNGQRLDKQSTLTEKGPIETVKVKTQLNKTCRYDMRTTQCKIMSLQLLWRAILQPLGCQSDQQSPTDGQTKIKII